MGTQSDPVALEQSYLQIVKDHLHKLGDAVLEEDLDLLCQYIVLRFLKTSPEVHSESDTDEVADLLSDFVCDIYPFLVTFVTMVNSTPLTAQGNEA